MTTLYLINNELIQVHKTMLAFNTNTLKKLWFVYSFFLNYFVDFLSLCLFWLNIVLVPWMHYDSSSYLMLYWNLYSSFIGFIWFPLIQRFEERCFYFLPDWCISSFFVLFHILLDSFLAIYGTLPLIEGFLDFLQSWALWPNTSEL